MAEEELLQLRKTWLSSRSPQHAAELVDAALVDGCTEIAARAAEQLLSSDVSSVSREMAQAVLGTGVDHNENETAVVEATQRYRVIANHKRYLRRTPHDPLRWVDLAREYAILGQNDPAAEAIRVALALAPSSRFVVRSASRFFLHRREPEKAHWVVNAAPNAGHDPWLVAAEIVAAGLSETMSRRMRLGRKMVDSNSFSPRHTSELAAALGTVEFLNNDRSAARKLVSRSLVDPTENSEAQAGWISRHTARIEAPSHFQAERPFEAKAWHRYVEGDYRGAVENSWFWLSDEPFATRPALFGSWVATTGLADYELGLRFIDAVIAANPDDSRLLLQKLFCLASLGRVDEAEAILARIEGAPRSYGTEPSQEQVILEADRGLIAMRRGRLGEGLAYYDQAIMLAREYDLNVLEAVARIYRALELATARPTAGEEALASARSVLEVFSTTERAAYEELIRIRLGDEMR